MPVGAVVHHHVLLLSVLVSFISGNGLSRILIYLSKKLPPLPKDAGWWAQFAYNLLGGASGLNPNSFIIPPGVVSRIMGRDAPEAT